MTKFFLKSLGIAVILFAIPTTLILAAICGDEMRVARLTEDVKVSLDQGLSMEEALEKAPHEFHSEIQRRLSNENKISILIVGPLGPVSKK